MAHTLDVTKLDQVFAALEENVHKLNVWEMDRLDEWKALHERGNKLSEKQLECLERMYLKT